MFCTVDVVNSGTIFIQSQLHTIHVGLKLSILAGKSYVCNCMHP